MFLIKQIMSRPIPIPTPKSTSKSRRSQWPDNTAPSRSPGPSFSTFLASPQSSPLPFKKNATNAADQMTNPSSPKDEDSSYAADSSGSSSSEAMSLDENVNVNAGKARLTTAISREENWAADTRLDLRHDRMVGRGVPTSDSMGVVGVEDTEEVAATDEIGRSSEVAGLCPPLSRMEAAGSSSSVPARGGEGGGFARRDRLPVLVGKGWMPGTSARD